MLKAFKYRLYPNKKQQVLLEKHFGCRRFIYNWGLEAKIKEYASAQKSISYSKMCERLTSLKKELPWLKEVNSQSLQSALKDLDTAYVRFFRKNASFPKFKSKKRSRLSFTVPQNGKAQIEDSCIIVPKISPIKTVFHRPFDGTIRHMVVSRTPTKKYFVSILVETPETIPEKKPVKKETTIGIDLGLHSFISTSNGGKIENPKHIKKHELRLKREQRRHSRKQKGSRNREKNRIRLARIYEKVSNCRFDFLNKLSHQLVHDNQVDTICIEDLNIKGMMKNRRLSRAIGEAGWSKFVSLLTYKTEWLGKNLIKIGRFAPSSKMCSVCGTIKKDLELSDRKWVCENCKTKHDRDNNAAKNIKAFGLSKAIHLKLGMDSSEVTPVEKRGRKTPSSKQEAKC